MIKFRHKHHARLRGEALGRVSAVTVDAESGSNISWATYDHATVVPTEGEGIGIRYLVISRLVEVQAILQCPCFPHRISSMEEDYCTGVIISIIFIVPRCANK